MACDVFTQETQLFGTWGGFVSPLMPLPPLPSPCRSNSPFATMDSANVSQVGREEGGREGGGTIRAGKGACVLRWVGLRW